MGRRKLLKSHERRAVFGLPTDDDSLIRHYTLSPSDLLEIQIRRRSPNQLGFAVQLCLMRYPGRTLMSGESLPPATLGFIARQLDIEPHEFHLYARREPTRMEHVAFLLTYLGMRTPTSEDRRVALSAAIDVAGATDKGTAIVSAIVAAFRERNVLLPTEDVIERMGLAARAIARRRAEVALLAGFSEVRLVDLDDLLSVDPEIEHTRFHWIRSAPDAPSGDNLIGLMERLTFIRSLEIDPQLQNRIHPERWNQMVREGDVTPAWLVADFNVARRRATIVAQLIKLIQKLTDDAVTMFCKLIGRLFSQANNRKKQRRTDARRSGCFATRCVLSSPPTRPGRMRWT